ncbi:sialate O-acetylesterase [Niabella sp. 22666]|uniref:sialate O-acetylesterase n=1 Tax=Niabella sp. 22666 TaxID=3453954 RepID=UPI003F87C00E
MSIFKQHILLAAAGLLLALGTSARITLPRIFTDGMVLQRDQPLAVWGTAGSRETIKVAINGQQASALSNAKGEWKVTLQPMRWGGPYDLTITSPNDKKVLRNILVGDVWICSGQSNMEMPVSGWSKVNNAEQEIAAANYPNIRLFTVEKATSFVPKNDLAGGQWLECTSTHIPSFSAVAYFFGRKINQDTKIPIGLISTNWGGTNIQAWTSWPTISGFDGYNHLDPAEMKQTFAEQDEKRKAYNLALANDRGSREAWYQNGDTEGWNTVQMPSLWESAAIGNTDGIIWFKKSFNLGSAPKDQNIVLHLGAIDDADSTYVNGTLVGHDNVWNKSRAYTISASVLKQGKNTVTIKMMDGGAQGGMSGKPEDLFISIGDQKISLAGDWYYQPSVISTTYNLIETGPNAFPSQLFNAMINPIKDIKIKGAIWYQGEANVNEADLYRRLFPSMIADWRKTWGYNFPFIWVQLANYLERKKEPGASAWAELRNAQHLTLSVPNTGEAVAIDIGEANDIHPRNKQDVGLRLALAAEKIAYSKNIVASGPVLASAKTESNKIIVSFTNTGSGLVAKNGKLNGFSIAGADQHFVWADAKITGNTVVVSSPSIKHPIAVRYAWADNPDASLYNKENLPASPFRTDNWPLTTATKKNLQSSK